MKAHAWMDAGKYVSHAASATVFLKYATDEPLLDEEMEKGYFGVVSEPRKYKIYKAPHALSPEATRIKMDLERVAREGDPPTSRLKTDWRERMEDMVWALVNSPEFVFVP